MLQQVQKKLPHPLVGIVIATAIAFSGRNELALRSWGLLGVAIWLAIDLWVWLLPEATRNRLAYSFGCTATSAMLIGMMGIMWWWMNGKLEDQRSEVFDHLTAEHALPNGVDPVFTLFTVTNNSTHALSGKHRLACKVNLEVGNNGTSTSGGFWEVLQSNSPQGRIGGVLGDSVSGGLINGDKAAEEYRNALPDSGVQLKGGGDAETNDCLRIVPFANGSDCIDVELVFWYSLDTQPNFNQEKRFRYVVLKEGDSFAWHSQPLGSKINYCRSFIK